MKYLILLISIFFCLNCYADTDQNLLNEVATGGGVALLNEEIRRVKEGLFNDYAELSDQINTISDTGFCVILAGDAEVITNKVSRVYMPFNGTITKIIAYAKTAPTGADLIIDVNKNGSTILDASKVTISAGANDVTIISFANDEFVTNDYFTFDIDQIGSTIAGADISLSFFITKES